MARADGFFLNVSNYETDERQLKYGNWISKCVYYGTTGPVWARGHFDWCASQYSPADPADFSTWGLTDAWYAENVGAVPADRLDPLRRRHQPQRPGPVDAAGRRDLAGRADLVQPAGSRVGLRPTTDR